MLASTTMMVPEEHYSRVNGLNQALQGTMTILTPLLGALLFEVLSMQRILSIDVGMSLVAIAPLLFFTIPQPVLEESTEVGGDSPSLLDDLKEGLRLVIGWPGIMMLMLVFGLVHLVFTPSMSLLPILVTDHFKGGALELAWLQSAMGVGVVTGGLILGVWGGFKRRIVTTILGLALAGVSMAVVGLTPANAFTLAAMGMFSVGLTVSFVVAARQAIIQVVVPPEMQGRVYTLVTSGWAVMDPVGLAIGGPLAEEFGVRILYVACSVVMVTLGVGAFFVPAIMQIENKTPATSRTL